MGEGERGREGGSRERGAVRRWKEEKTVEKKEEEKEKEEEKVEKEKEKARHSYLLAFIPPTPFYAPFLYLEASGGDHK